MKNKYFTCFHTNARSTKAPAKAGVDICITLKVNPVLVIFYGLQEGVLDRMGKAQYVIVVLNNCFLWCFKSTSSFDDDYSCTKSHNIFHLAETSAGDVKNVKSGSHDRAKPHPSWKIL